MWILMFLDENGSVLTQDMEVDSDSSESIELTQTIDHFNIETEADDTIVIQQSSSSNGQGDDWITAL